MTDPTPPPGAPAPEPEPTPDPSLEVVTRFVHDLDAAPEPGPVLRRYAREHPGLTDEFRDLAESHAALDAAAGRHRTPARLGDFRIGREIDHGGMGLVYEAVQEPLGRRVAVKLIRGNGHPVPAEVRERFLNEQRVLARLHHTHIVPIHAAGRDGPIEYYAMPYIPGAPLSDLVHDARSFGSSGPRSATPSLAELAASRAGPSGDGETTHPPTLSAARRSSRPVTAPPVTAALSGAVPVALARPAPRPLPDAPRSRLSARYYQSVARVMADAADALDHAHRCGVVHRDLKPSNILVDCAGHAWVVDFGLACEIDRAAAPGLDPPRPLVVGTPPYMAPEQFEGRCDPRTDVWGLGVTLYELLTLRRAFPDPATIPTHDPRAPRAAAGDVPRDLNAICLKAIRRDPADRYQTAGSLAADLRRWLAHEPVGARWVDPVRRSLLWSRRNKGWAVAAAGASATLLAATVLSALAGERQRRETDAQRREVHVQHVERNRLSPHLAGWSDEAWEEARAASQLRPTVAGGFGGLQSAAAGTLRGLDAYPETPGPGRPAGAVAFDPSGRLLAAPGAGPDGPASGEALVWEPGAAVPRTLGPPALGPVAFGPDGSARQLVADAAGGRLSVVDLGRGRPPLDLPLPAALDLPPGEDASVALSADGTLAAAPVVRPGRRHALAVWDARSGLLIREIPGRALCAAFSPDGTLVAGGGHDGRVTVTEVATGAAVASLRRGRLPVYALAFARDPLRRGAGERPGWLLAAGGDGGTLTVWDVGTGQPRSTCLATDWAVYGLAFRPDGAVVASCGRHVAHLWDVATGRLLLSLPTGAYARGLAFAPDGRRLAVASDESRAPTVGLRVWRLSLGRGLTTYLGLGGNVCRVILSPDGRHVAALADGWQVGVWDRATGALRFVLNVPRGYSADNAALAFSPDGQRLAFAAGNGASLWDMTDGHRVDRWSLPPGLQDNLAFDGPNLRLARLETAGGAPPLREFPPDRSPRVVVFRRLTAEPRSNTLVRVVRDYPHHAYLDVVPGGRYVVVDGYATSGQARHVLAVHDLATGLQLASMPRRHASPVRLDPLGGLLGLQDHGPARPDEGLDLWSVPDLKPSGRLKGSVWMLGPGARCWFDTDGRTSAHPFQFVVRDRDSVEPRVRIPVDTGQPYTACAGVGATGCAEAAWGERDGTVVVADPAEVRRRLGSIGLGW